MKPGDLIVLRTPNTNIPLYEWTGFEMKFLEGVDSYVRMWNLGSVGVFLGPEMTHLDRSWGRVLFEGRECWVSMIYIKSL